MDTTGPVRFGKYTFNVDTGVLRQKGVRVALQAQPARLLALLVRHHGNVVTRDAIREHVWGSTAVEFDQNINYCIRQIRLALGEDSGLVQTVPRQGYRFIATPVQLSSIVWNHSMARSLPAAMLLALGLAIGFCLGVLAHEPDPLRFVYLHVTGRAHCPYLDFLSSSRPNS